MKKYLILLFIFIQGLIFSATKSLSDIKTLKFDVVEKTNIKSKKRETESMFLSSKEKQKLVTKSLMTETVSGFGTQKVLFWKQKKIQKYY